MSAPTTGLDLSPLVYRLDELDRQAKAVKAEQELIREEIARRLPPGASWARSDGRGVRWSKPVHTFNPVRARGVLHQVLVATGEDWLTPTLVPTPEKERAQAYVPTRLFEACCDVKAPYLVRWTEKSR